MDALPTVLVLAPRGRDAAVIAQVLSHHGCRPVVCVNLTDLAGRLADDTTVAVLTEESLDDGGTKALQAWIDSQASWSDFPFIVLATRLSAGRSNLASATLARLGNAVLLERPLNGGVLVSAVNSAVRSRRRQYEARGQLRIQETIGQENRRLYEAERQARGEAEAANRAKDEFLATLSHELRTPLSAILGWTYVLQQRRSDLGDLARGVDTIERNARSQAKLIEDLLDMSRIVAGKVTLELQTVVPAQLLEQVISSLNPMAQAKGVAIDSAIAPALTPATADSQRLQQVFRNLLTNAIKFTPAGGTVRVDATVAGEEMAISVSDTGMGIAPDFLPHVFERFRQADGSMTRSHGGLGLGLAIVRRLVELHGGSVEAFSAGLGSGATFTVRLPIAREHESGGLPVTAMARLGDDEVPEPRIRDVRILLVEDDRDGREMVDRMLSDRGARVHAVESAAHALAALTERPFDIVISDIGMPHVDGYELLTRIRTSGNAIPAIALTAFARMEDQARALEAGYAAHLSKPVEAPALMAAVADVALRDGQGTPAVARTEGGGNPLVAVVQRDLLKSANPPG